MPVSDSVAQAIAPVAEFPVLFELISPKGETLWLDVPDGDLTLGASSRCDLRLTGGPGLHSVIHRQGANLWIETADEDSRLEVDGKPVRRLALRDGDQLTVSGYELSVHIGESARLAAQKREAQLEAAGMSAEELCDRIAAEEAAIEQFEGRRRLGLQALLAALTDVAEEQEPTAFEQAEDQRYEELLDQIRQLSETLESRTQLLADRETELLETSSQLQSVQERMTHQLDELMTRLNQKTSGPDELRASA